MSFIAAADGNIRRFFTYSEKLKRTFRAVSIARIAAEKRESSLLHEAGFQGDGHAVHLAINLVIAVHQAD